MTTPAWIRLALSYLALLAAQVGVWALVAPRSFYDDFPGFGRTWVSVDGPYNEHLVRDVGALNLALLVVLVAAAVTLSRPLVLAAAGSSFLWGTPHLLYHLFNTDGLGAGDLAVSLGGLTVSVVLPAAIAITVVGGGRAGRGSSSPG